MLRLSSLLISSLVASVASQGTKLGDHLNTRTDAQEYADIALDLRDIRVYVEKGQQDQALGLFENGLHAEHTVGNKWSLSQLNEDMVGDKSRTPMYLFHLYGLNNLSPTGDQDRSRYINTYITELMNTRFDLVPDAIVAISMWMYATHLLYNGATLCYERTIADNPNSFNIGGGGMDEFIAFWIGSDQPVASDLGHGLYSWAQTAGTVFGKSFPEAEVNRNLKILYQEGAQALSVNRACTTNNRETAKHMWEVVARMKREMLIPMFQYLIFYLVERDDQHSQLYGRALIPSLSQIRPSLFRRLKDALADGRLIDFEKTEEYISDLREAASYFGISCEDIGSIASDIKTACGSRDRFYPIAGYKPSHDVQGLSRVDLDVRQIRILRDIEAYRLAELWYLYGQNVENVRDSDTDQFELISLHDMALSTDRQKADPFFSDFVSFFEDTNFGSTAMLKALDDNTKWETRSQNTEIANSVAVYQILLIQVIAKLKHSVEVCKTIDPDDFEGFTNSPVDEAAALMIGSLEGRLLGGSTDFEDGQLLYHAANKHAEFFGTLNEYGYARVNSEIEDLLYAAKGAFEAFDCGNLDRTIQRLIRLMTVGIVQLALHEASLIVDDRTNEKIRNISLAKAEGAALALVPLIAVKDGASAQTLYENLVWSKDNTSVRGGLQVLADALGQAMTRAFRLPCEYIGAFDGIDPCINVESSSKPSNYLLVIIVGTMTMLQALL